VAFTPQRKYEAKNLPNKKSRLFGGTFCCRTVNNFKLIKII